MSVNGVPTCVRPFKLMALLCVFLALCLDVAALVSPAWVTAEGYYLSLWESCVDNGAAWTCASTLTSDWQVASVVLLLSGAALTILCFLFSVTSLCRGTNRKHYRTIGIVLFTAVLLQACALVLYPVKFMEFRVLHTYHEFSWGYGLGWGATIFLLGGGILLCLRTDIYNDGMY